MDPSLPTTQRSRRFDALAEALSVAVLTASQDLSVDYANPAARELFWRVDADLLGTGWLTGVDRDDRRLVEAAIADLGRGGVAEFEFRIDVAGHTRWVRGRLSPADEDTRPDDGLSKSGGGVGWVGVFDDVTADRANVSDLAFRAGHDELTGLPNRTLLYDRIDQAVAHAERVRQPIAVLFVDLDRFKPVNDLHGHAVGDLVLQEVARRLSHEVRAADTVARLGGDEFVVVTPCIDRDVAARVARRLIDAIQRPITVSDGIDLCIAASAGISWGIPPPTPAGDLIASADHAMYEAKRTGLDIVFAPEQLDPESGASAEAGRS